jgi:hexosaminidase
MNAWWSVRVRGTLRVVLFGAAIVVLGPSAAMAEYNSLLPRPRNIHYGTGRLPLQGLIVQTSSPGSAEDIFAAHCLSEELSHRLGSQSSLSVSEAPGERRTIRLNRTGGIDALAGIDESIGPNSREAYSVHVTPNGVEIKARSSAGIYYGVQTLRQLIVGTGEAAFLPVVEIEDWPHFAYRGAMVDMSHGPLLTEDEVKRQIDFLARWKVNQYYFYSETSIELEGFPLLSPDGRFTQDQVRRIVQYARERHIDVVPCLELFGHLHDLLRIEKYAHLGISPHRSELKSGDPNVMALLANWAEQFVRMFPSPFVHIGFDETRRLELAAKREGNGVTPAQVFVRQLSNVARLFARHDRRVMAWADIMVKYPEVVAELPPGLIGVAWEYEPDGNFRKWLDPLEEKRIPTFIATGVSNWRELTPDFETTFDNIDNFVAAARRPNVIGFMNTLWSDTSQSLMRLAWPALAYGAVASWQEHPVDRIAFFQSYCALMYPASIATNVAAAMEQVGQSELQLQKALGRKTLAAFWSDPFAPAVLNKAQERRTELAEARLLAEEAQENLYRAGIADGDRFGLKSWLVGARMLDYAGLRFLAAVEIADHWKEFEQMPKDGMKWRMQFASGWFGQTHGRAGDLMDAITELRQKYRAAWLDEYTDFRLASALGRWDAEYNYWRELQARLEPVSENVRMGEHLPPLQSVLRGH